MKFRQNFFKPDIEKKFFEKKFSSGRLLRHYSDIKIAITSLIETYINDNDGIQISSFFMTTLTTIDFIDF